MKKDLTLNSKARITVSKKTLPQSKARQITPNTRQRLFSLSGNLCAFPACTQKFAEKGRLELMAQICHIEAAEPGGQRYNPNSDDDYRRSFENLILLCPIHHIETNDVSKYTVKVLKEMKSNHEAKMLQISSSQGILSKYPTALVTVINQINTVDLSEKLDVPSNLNSFDPDEKIKFNNVRRYKPIIEEYRAYQGKLSVIYREIEESGSFKKEQLLQNIKTLYLQAKGKLLNGDDGVSNIQEKADELIEEVQNSLWVLVERSSNLSEQLSYEAISLSLYVILVDAFLRCKILEEPPKQ